MRRVKRLTLVGAFLLALLPLAHGQIYADFAVSHGATPLGTFRVRLDYDKAPRTCANFIGLATGRRPWIDVTSGTLRENQHFYDGLTFHRLIHNFVIQGGSPNGLGTDGPGYSILDEYHADLRHSGPYKLSMAKGSNPNTGGAQFFITLAATPFLDDKHSVFGEVISGRDIIDGFMNATAFPTDTSSGAATKTDKPLVPIVINSVVIGGPDYAGFDLDNPALRLPILSGISPTPKKDLSTNRFSLTFDRAQRHEYLISSSTDLSAWGVSGYFFSLDAAAAYNLDAFGVVTVPRYFTRTIDIDYSSWTNAPSAITQNGRKLRIISRAADWVELTFNGSTGGTWSASNGSSGTLSGVTWSDSAPDSGTAISGSSQIRFVPMGQLRATFDGPAGTGGWKSFVVTGQGGTALTLSFHSPTSGWVEGVANTSASVVSVNQSFTLTP